MKSLRISPDLSLPMDTITATLVVYGGKGSGKTNLGGVIVEELTKAGLRWCLLDPLGVSWGLRHSADGKGPGVECLILGGVHGDIPIEPTGGAIVADLVADEHVNVLIDFSRRSTGQMLSIGEKIRFITDYAHRLFQRQGELINGLRREPLFQLLDEAARYIPQVMRAGDVEIASCVGAWEQLVEEGRNVGIGVGLLTQRSARMNKSVSELADAMFAFRTVGPNSLEAITDWLGSHVEKKKISQFQEIVRSLPVGSALVVSPGWLQFEAIARIRLRDTFDSSATPKPGERIHRVSGKAAKPDLAKYVERMQSTIERAKQSDPREIRKRYEARIVELERELKAKSRPVAAAKVAAPDRERMRKLAQKVADRALAVALRPLFTTMRAIASDFLKITRNLSLVTSAFPSVNAEFQVLIDLAKEIEARGITTEAPNMVPMPDGGRGVAQSVRAERPPVAAHKVAGSSPAVSLNLQQKIDSFNGVLPAGERAVLIAVAQSRELGASREYVGIMTGYKRSTRDLYIQLLVRKGLVTKRGAHIFATSDGLAALPPDYEPLPTGDELREYWMRTLPAGERAVLVRAIDAYPNAVDREHVSELTGYKRSTRDLYIQKLGRLRLVTTGADGIRANDLLFVG